MIRYRIYTEHKSPEATEDALALVTGAGFDGFTVYHGTGYWKGIPERNLTIEIITEDLDNVKVVALAERVRVFLKQEAVLVTREEIAGVLLQRGW